MRRFALLRILPPALAALAGVILQTSCGSALARDVTSKADNWALTQIQFKAPDALPRTMVVRGTWPDTGRLAAAFAGTGLFDVFVTTLDDRLAREAEKIDVDNAPSCHSSSQLLSPDSVKLECIRRAQPGLLPGCSLQVNLTGPPKAENVAQHARIFIVLDHGEPCPFYDQRYLAENLRTNGLRAWRTSRLLAEIASPTPQTILRALGVEPSTMGH